MLNLVLVIKAHLRRLSGQASWHVSQGGCNNSILLYLLLKNWLMHMSLMSIGSFSRYTKFYVHKHQVCKCQTCSYALLLAVVKWYYTEMCIVHYTCSSDSPSFSPCSWHNYTGAQSCSRGMTLLNTKICNTTIMPGISEDVCLREEFWQSFSLSWGMTVDVETLRRRWWMMMQ